MKIVKITWHDCHTELGWNDEACGGCAVVYSVGFLIEKNDEHYVIATSYTDDGETNTRTYIPMGCVIKVEDVV